MELSQEGYHDYGYRSGTSPYAFGYLLKELEGFCGALPPGARVLDIGCGNGFLAGYFLGKGCRVVGIDLSTTGIHIARSSHPGGRFEIASADENILAVLNEPPFDIVVSTEVIEHLYAP